MNKLRPLLAALMAVGCYTVTDILVWQRIFETHQMIEYADMFHTGWFVSLAGYAAVGVIILSDRWRDCLFFLASLFVGAYSGLEDVLYYVLDRKPMPASLPWLAGNPLIHGSSREEVLGSVVLWLVGLAVLYLNIYHRGARLPAAAGASSARGS